MMNLSASDLTKLTVMIDGQPRGRLATTAKTVDRLRKTLAVVIGDAAATVIDLAIVCETCGGAEAIIQRALPQGSPRGLVLAAAINVEFAPVAAQIDTDGMGEAEFTAFAQKAETKRRHTSAAVTSQAAATGQMPTPPDFSATTHARFRGKLAGLIGLAERGDTEGPRAFVINPVSSSPKALARYRDLCVIAITARAPMVA